MSDTPAWIQAGAAVAQVFTAIVIYKVTKEYVGLTRSLVESAHDQLRAARLARLDDDEQRSATLSSRALALEARVSELPDRFGGGIDRAMRQAPLWTSGEVEALQTVATGTLSLAGPAAASVAVHLSWLLARAEEVRAVHPLQGFDYTRLDADEWMRRRAEALRGLRELAQMGKIAGDLAVAASKSLAPQP